MPDGLIAVGNNDVELTGAALPGVAVDFILADWVELTYSRGFAAVADQLSVTLKHGHRKRLKAGDTATYTIAAAESTTAEHPEIDFIIPQASVVLESFEDGEFPLFAELPRSAYNGPFSYHLVVTDSATGEAKRIEIRFRGP